MALILHFLIVQNFCEYFTHEMRLTKRHQSQHKIQETIATATFGTAAQQSKYLKVSNNSLKHLDETMAASECKRDSCVVERAGSVQVEF